MPLLSNWNVPVESPAGQHLVGLGVVERQRRHVDADVLALLDQLERRLDDVEVAQAQEVHLEQTERRHVVHAELGDHLGVALLLQRDVLGERLVGDDDAGGVDGVVADEALERHGEIDHLTRGLVFVVGGLELAAVGHGLLEGGRRRLLGDHLGDAVADRIGQPQHAGGVAGGGPCRQGAEGDDLGDVVAPVLLRHVLDDLVAAFHREVHVDVGHRLAARVQEALEEQVVLERVDVGDAQRVGHDAARRRTASGPHRDA